MNNFEHCRENCAACCIYLSISSPIPGMPKGKPAGVRCIHLTNKLLCAIYNHPDRPKVCDDFKFDPELCGKNTDEARKNIQKLENCS